MNMNFIISKKINKTIDWENINLGLISKKKCLIFKKYNKILSNKKTIIDSDNYNYEWDKMKKIANPYELIYTTYSKKYKKESIANYKPISRSFYKLWEINNYFNLLDSNIKEHYISNLAEGPGGFMEALIKYGNGIHQLDLKLFGLTLYPNNKYIPDWAKMKNNFLSNNINISYGNLYKWVDIEKYIKNFDDKKCSLVTADGGFDYSNNFNGQEIDSYKIIFAEIFLALLILENGGNFVCKIFDIYSLFSLKLIYILTTCFSEIHIYKPLTSRPANSEKYIICKNFSGLDTNAKNKIIELFKKIETMNITNEIVLNFNGIHLNNNFINIINIVNEKYLNNQLFYIDKIVELIEDKDFNEKYDYIISEQVKNAVNWCEYNKININKECEYYIKYFK